MQDGDVGLVMREAMLVVVKLGGPPLVMTINEQSLTFVPKIVIIGGTLMLLGPFMMSTLRDYMHLVLDRLIATGGM